MAKDGGDLYEKDSITHFNIVLCIKSCWLWAFYGRHHKE